MGETCSINIARWKRYRLLFIVSQLPCWAHQKQTLCFLLSIATCVKHLSTTLPLMYPILPSCTGFCWCPNMNRNGTFNNAQTGHRTMFLWPQVPLVNALRWYSSHVWFSFLQLIPTNASSPILIRPVPSRAWPFSFRYFTAVLLVSFRNCQKVI